MSDIATAVTAGIVLAAQIGMVAVVMPTHPNISTQNVSVNHQLPCKNHFLILTS